MATLSSHVLDAALGTHASGIRIALFRCTGAANNAPLFDVIANEQGRISETIAANQVAPTARYELVFYSADYFHGRTGGASTNQLLDSVIIRLRLSDSQASVHIPLVLSPHSYTVWWSG